VTRPLCHALDGRQGSGSRLAARGEPRVNEDARQRAGLNLELIGLLDQSGVISLVEAEGHGLGHICSLSKRCE
jgi:hypothetical protein